MSQLDLALDAGISARHLSFLETGRSAPSRSMVVRLAAALDMPPREQNRLLTAAGLAPEYRERPLDAPEMATVRDGLEQVLAAYDPFPCLAVDRRWDVVRVNAATAVLLDGVAPHLLERPNALRIALHPQGLAPRIRNLAQWRRHLLARLRREVAGGGSADSSALLAELESLPGPDDAADPDDPDAVVVPLRLRGDDDSALTFLSTVTTFGTALDLTAAELSVEAFLPADAATAAYLHRIHTSPVDQR